MSILEDVKNFLSPSEDEVDETIEDVVEDEIIEEEIEEEDETIESEEAGEIDGGKGEEDEETKEDSELETDETKSEETKEVSKDVEIEEEEEGVEVEENKSAETSEMRVLRLQNEALQNKVNSLSQSSAEVAPVADKMTIEKLMESIDDPEEIMSDKEKFVEFFLSLSKVTANSAVENSMTMTPEVVSQFIAKRDQLNRVRTKFYDNNPELVEVQDYVAEVANSIAAENPDKPLQEVLDITSKRVYKALKLEEEVSKTETKAQRKKPAFAKTTRGKSRKKAPSVTGLQNDLDTFNNV